MRRRLTVGAVIVTALVAAVLMAPRSESVTPYTWEANNGLRPLPAVSPVGGVSPTAAVEPPVGTSAGRSPSAVSKPAPTRQPTIPPSAGRHLVSGWASYWPAQGGAASKWLAAALGGGRKYLGQYVTVSANGRSVRVKLVTSCACGDRHGEHTVIDLPEWAFARLAPLGQGIVSVSVSR